MLLHGKSNHSIYFTHLVKYSIINVRVKTRSAIRWTDNGQASVTQMKGKMKIKKFSQPFANYRQTIPYHSICLDTPAEKRLFRWRYAGSTSHSNAC